MGTGSRRRSSRASAGDCHEEKRRRELMPTPGPCSRLRRSARPAPPKSRATRAQGGDLSTAYVPRRARRLRRVCPSKRASLPHADAQLRDASARGQRRHPHHFAATRVPGCERDDDVRAWTRPLGTGHSPSTLGVAEQSVRTDAEVGSCSSHRGWAAARAKGIRRSGRNVSTTVRACGSIGDRRASDSP
jgi:hypothetical protein